MPSVWRALAFNDAADGTIFSSSPMANPGYASSIGIGPGERILRTRLWGQLVIAQKDIHPTTYIPGEFILGCNQILVGVYYAGPLGTDWPPPLVGQTPGDGNWLIRTQMQLHQMHTMVDVNSFEYAWGVYTVPEAAHDSKADRGKATAASQIGIKWTFFNPVVDWWTENTSDVLGLTAMSLWCEVLVETP